MRPGVVDRLGLGPDEVRRANPAIVYLSITGYGVDAGPDRPGFDIAAQAESGMMSVTGEPDRDPQRVGFTVVDSATAYAATNAVLAALFRRERTGEGAVIDTSLLEVAIHLQGANWVHYFTTGEPPARTGNGQPWLAPAAEVIAVEDGQLVLSAYTAAHWARLCAALGRPELVEDPRFADNDARVAHRAELIATLTAALRGLGRAEAVRRLGGAGIVVGAIRDYAQVAAGEDAARLGSFPTATGGGTGSYRHAAAPYTFRGRPRGAGRSAPAVGEHSRAVLRRLGYRDPQIDDLVAAGVIREAPGGPG
jgi:crotonobetainyl-CoA:carnitine CoA-transferase CaiB-like acyl-CoA transferase